MNKQAVRHAVGESITQLDDRVDRERMIEQHLFSLPEWTEATSIAVTLSFRNECSTDRIIDQAWSEGKRVVIPKVVGKQMKFFEHTANHVLLENTMGIREPDEQASEILLNTVDLCIVPGRAYTRSGYRIGWGGGFYDRSLVEFSGATLSIAFAIQVVEQFEVESFDQPVDMIVTEEEVIRCR
ncbi:5-formyltetrahydrofolate cyclo-ligase [Exiguobacterium sp. s193]|uniref:5-formyltetrahydrofolate cyclo-ligase n=1 Tax=Exiguobacterium sp. s193 TaxID=2751207 RepID=UPI001BEBF167